VRQTFKVMIDGLIAKPCCVSWRRTSDQSSCQFHHRSCYQPSRTCIFHCHADLCNTTVISNTIFNL